MSKLTLEDAISHCLETAEQLEERANIPYKVEDSELQDNACRECAADHRQLAEWLTELKEWKENPFLQIITECRKNYYCNNCTFINHCPFAKWLTELREARRLLKAAVEDIHSRDYCNGCIYENAEGKEQYLNCEYHNCFKWRYADEAEKLLND